VRERGRGRVDQLGAQRPGERRPRGDLRADVDRDLVLDTLSSLVAHHDHD
jgi:hypothetical protein